MDKVKKIGIISLIVIVVLGLGWGSISIFYTKSSGSRIGEIVKFSKKGVFIKTFEGTMNVGGVSKDGSGDVTPSKWDFSVHRNDDVVISAIDDAMAKGYEVRLYYKQKLYQFDWRGDTDYFITKVEKVNH